MRIVSLTDLPEEGVSHDPDIRKRVMLRAGVVPHLTNFSRSRLAPGQRTTPHAHGDMYEVFLVETGDGLLTLDGRAFPLPAGTCILVEPGEEHWISNVGTTELVLTYFGIVG